MRNKLSFLTGVSLKRKIKTKWFVIANIILAVLIVGLINIDSIISFFGGDFDKKQKIHIVDNTNRVYDVFEEQLNASNKALESINENFSYEIVKAETDLEGAKKIIEENDEDIAIIFDNDEENVIKTTIISTGYIDTFKFQILNSSINGVKTLLAIQDSNISLEEYNKIHTPSVIERIYIDETKKSEDESMETIMTTVFPVVILPFFMLTIFLVQMIGAEVNDEKTTRGMEIIISNVSPKTHFFSKIISGNLFVILQGVMIFAFGAIGLLVRKLIGGSNIVNGLGAEVGKIINEILKTNIGNQLVYIIPLSLLLMLITFIAYSLLAGILASMTTNIEDFQQLQTPIVIILLIGYYLAMMAGMFKGALFIRILSYVPLISAILSPSLLVLGQIGVIDIIISIVITLGLNYLLIKYGLKIYKVGILNYSSANLWKKMLKAIKD